MYLLCGGRDFGKRRIFMDSNSKLMVFCVLISLEERVSAVS